MAQIIAATEAAGDVQAATFDEGQDIHATGYQVDEVM
jgi:hypothetical protein